jgi:hypothetical protein
MDNQIEFNINLEKMIDEMKLLEYKKNKKIDNFSFKIKNYKKKINKYKEIETNNVEKKIRQSMYIDTCNEMILHFEEEINNVKDEHYKEIEFMKDVIWNKFNDNFEIIDDKSVIVKEDNYIYYLPSARITFRKAKKYISDEKVFINFLEENNVNENIETILEKCQIWDGTIQYKVNGFDKVVQGLSLTYGVEIKFM